MKKIVVLFVIFTLASCDSFFSDVEIIENSGVDTEGDPIVINPDPENESLGAEGGYCYGFSTPDETLRAIIEIPAFFPEKIDLSQYLPEVRSQGKQGSCVAWATGYYLKSFQENIERFRNGSASNDQNMSPAYLFNQIKVNPCDGAVVQRALDTLAKQGITIWNQIPYDQNNCDQQPTTDQLFQAANNRIESYHYLEEGNVFLQAKAFLNQDQPIVIAVSIDRTYFGAKDVNGDSAYRKFRTNQGGHAMLVVGYDDAKNAFKAVNSWGKNWGDQGFVWIDYKAFIEAGDPNSDFQILCEAWVAQDLIYPVNPPTPAAP